MTSALFEFSVGPGENHLQVLSDNATFFFYRVMFISMQGLSKYYFSLRKADRCE